MTNETNDPIFALPANATTASDKSRPLKLRPSKSDVYETPQALFAELDRVFHFDLDVCALPENAKCAKFFSPAEDGLKQEWRGVCWCNPPYNRALDRWVRKAALSALAGATVVCLLPSRTGRPWWSKYVERYASHIEFIPGRLTFEGQLNNAPMDCAIVVFAPAKDSHRWPRFSDDVV